jgi:hypothetical protein
MQLFINQVKSSPELLRIRLLQIIIDLLMTHDKTFLSASNPNVSRSESSALTVDDRTAGAGLRRLPRPETGNRGFAKGGGAYLHRPGQTGPSPYGYQRSGETHRLRASTP